MGRKKHIFKKAGKFFKKAGKVAKKVAKTVEKVSKVAGPILEEVGALTGQPELIALGEGATLLSKGLKKGLNVEAKLEKAIKSGNPADAIDVIGDVAKDFGIADDSIIEQAKLRAKQASSIALKASQGDLQGAALEGAGVVGKEALGRGLINKKQLKQATKIVGGGAGKFISKVGGGAIGQEQEVEAIRGKLLELLMDINDDEVDNPARPVFGPAPRPVQQIQLPANLPTFGPVNKPTKKKVVKKTKKPSLSKTKKADLQKMAKAKGVSHLGTKAQIHARL